MMMTGMMTGMMMTHDDELTGQDDMKILSTKQRPAMKAVVGLLGCISTRTHRGAHYISIQIENYDTLLLTKHI